MTKTSARKALIRLLAYLVIVILCAGALIVGTGHLDPIPFALATVAGYAAFQFFGSVVDSQN